MGDSRRIRWFVEPIGTEANESICKSVPECQLNEQIRCADGHLHDLCEVTYEQLRAFQRSSSKVSFKVWRQRGNGQIEPRPPQGNHDFDLELLDTATHLADRLGLIPKKDKGKTRSHQRHWNRPSDLSGA